MTVQLLVGTYEKRGGAGLHRATWSEVSGWEVSEPDDVARNASFASYSRKHDLYYLVNEEDAGSLLVLRATDGSDGWEQVAQTPTRGEAPCYVALDPQERWLAAANYGSGSIALFGLDDRTGLPVGPPDIWQNMGRGPDDERQERPHAHCACFDRNQRWLYHVDLGADQILSHRFSPEEGFSGDVRLGLQAPPGSGPRHLAFHPILPLALLVSELASTLTVLQVSDGSFAPKQVVSTIPPGFTRDNLAGHVTVNLEGDRVYVTNRGHDSIAVFRWDAAGRLEPLQHVATGKAPRSLVLLEAERRVVVANEEGGSLASYPMRTDGTLSLSQVTVDLPGAVFLLVANS